MVDTTNILTNLSQGFLILKLLDAINPSILFPLTLLGICQSVCNPSHSVSADRSSGARLNSSCCNHTHTIPGRRKT